MAEKLNKIIQNDGKSFMLLISEGTYMNWIVHKTHFFVCTFFV